MKKKTSAEIAPLPFDGRQQLDDGINLAKWDRRSHVGKIAFKQPERDNLREDSLNRYIEAAKVKALHEFLPSE